MQPHLHGDRRHQPLGHRRARGLDQLSGVEDLRRVLSLPPDGEELARELGRPARRVDDAPQVGARDRVEALVLQHQAADRGDRREGVVDLVGDAAGQAGDRVHLLRLQELLAELGVLGLRRAVRASSSLRARSSATRSRSPRRRSRSCRRATRAYATTRVR